MFLEWSEVLLTLWTVYFGRFIPEISVFTSLNCQIYSAFKICCCSLYLVSATVSLNCRWTFQYLLFMPFPKDQKKMWNVNQINKSANKHVVHRLNVLFLLCHIQHWNCFPKLICNKSRYYWWWNKLLEEFCKRPTTTYFCHDTITVFVLTVIQLAEVSSGFPGFLPQCSPQYLCSYVTSLVEVYRSLLWKNKMV